MPIDALASKLLFDYIASHDKVDTMCRLYGNEHIDFFDALDDHLALHFELKELLKLGLEQKAKQE